MHGGFGLRYGFRITFPFSSPMRNRGFSISVSHTVCPIITPSLNEIRSLLFLVILLTYHSRSLKLVPFESLGAVSYSPSIVTRAVSVTACDIFTVKEWRDLENQVKGRSRWLKMAPFDRSIDHNTTFYWSAIVNIALSGIIFELFDVEWYRDLEIWVRVHSRSLKLIPFDSLGAVSYSPSIVTMALSCINSEIKPDIGRKSWFFHTTLHSTPALGWFPSEYWHPVWYEKTRMVGLPDDEKILRISITV